jgi:transposase
VKCPNSYNILVGGYGLSVFVTGRMGVSALTKQICGELLGYDGRSPSVLAVKYQVSKWAIYKRRRRYEEATGNLLPRPHREGRPIKAA